jgi:hypothetical protein
MSKRESNKPKNVPVFIYLIVTDEAGVGIRVILIKG